MVADTLFYAIPEAIDGRREYILHHVLGLLIFVAVPYVTPDISIFCGRMIIMEMTSIFFTTAYLIRNAGYETSIFVSVFEISFAISFFFVRVLNGFDMAYHVARIMIFENVYDDSKATYGKCLVLLFIPILAMQVYWFVIIVQKSTQRMMKRASPDHKED
jgi:hypothetical protein